MTGQRLEPDRAVLACRVVEPDQWCRRCGSEGAARDTVIRRLAHEPLGWRPTVLEVVVRRYRCADCGHVWRQDTSAAAEPRAKLSRTGLRWALEGIVVAHLTVARVAEGLGVAWDTANNAVLAEGKRLLINDPTRFEGVNAASVDISLDVLVTLAQAIRDHVTVRFDYASREATDSDRSEARPARRAEPHHLVTSHGRWYLVSWDLDREDWRLFSVDRIRPRTPHGAPFIPRTVPGGDVGEFVSARFKGSDVNQWPCRGTVILHLPARDVLPFAGDGTVTALSEGTCTLEAGSWSWGALAASFGRFEVAMEVVEPPELAAAFTALADRFAATSRSANAAP